MCAKVNDSNSDVFQWIGLALKDENITTYEIEIAGTSNKGDNYMGDIVFVDVDAVKLTGEQLRYNLVVKIGQKDPFVRETFRVRLMCEREIFVYRKIVPAYKQLQEERHLEQIDWLPKCYGTILDEDNEVIIFQDLRKIGYELHDRYTNFDMEHIKVTLSAYGKLHALSFAYRDQKRKSFDKLFSNVQSLYKTLIKLADIQAILKKVEELLHEILQLNDPTLLERYRTKMKVEFLEKFEELLYVDDAQTAFIHGDCWNNNIMFKYREDDTKLHHPSEATLLDFQYACLAPPVFDISHHIYTVCSSAELNRLPELLQIYYSSFSSYLKKLGSDPDKLYPYTDLVEQWQKYSGYGLIMALYTLPVVLKDAADTVELKVLDTNALNNMFAKLDIKTSKITPRILGVVTNFVEFNDIRL